MLPEYEYEGSFSDKCQKNEGEKKNGLKMGFPGSYQK
jgi:hypothetical protein